MTPLSSFRVVPFALALLSLQATLSLCVTDTVKLETRKKKKTCDSGRRARALNNVRAVRDSGGTVLFSPGLKFLNEMTKTKKTKKNKILKERKKEREGKDHIASGPSTSTEAKAKARRVRLKLPRSLATQTGRTHIHIHILPMGQIQASPIPDFRHPWLVQHGTRGTK